MPYRVTRYRLLMVKDGSITTTWNRQVRQSKDVADLMAPVFAGLDREAFFVVLLDAKNRASGYNLVSLGSLTAALVHPREVFKPAIRRLGRCGRSRSQPPEWRSLAFRRRPRAHQAPV